jgi:hypothetical protein
VANATDGDVSILLGVGDATFGAKADYEAGWFACSIAVGDFNRDGIPDLATANRSSSSVSILLGNGSGGFSAKVDYALGTNPNAVAVGDFNGDGIPDLATANYTSNNVSILPGVGNGTFGTKVDYAAGTDPRSVTVGDFNRDGAPDLAVARYQEGFGKVSVLLNTAPSAGTLFNAAVNYNVGTSPRSVAAGDFNRDGKPDLATANFGSDNVSILLGTGSGGFDAKVDYGAGTQPISVAVGDFDRDGIPDLATANFGSANVSILLGNGLGAFTGSTVAAGSAPYSVAVGDFNRDGIPDLATANSGDNNVSILLGTGSGGFTAGSPVAVGAIPFSVAVGDFDRDGIPDLAVANYSDNDVSILLGNGSGGFTAGSPVAVGNDPQSVAVGDFDRDGKPDLAVANYNDDNVSILLGDGDGTFTAAASPAAGTGPASVAVGDFNNDGKPDLAVANYSDNNVSILLGDGDGTFGTASDYGVGANPYSVAVGDFNRDGAPDLAVTNENDNNVSIRYTVVAPTVTTGAATSVEEDSACLNGTITNDGGAPCKWRFRWGTTQGGPYPSQCDWQTPAKSTGESFSVCFEYLLSKGQKYYCIAQATNDDGVTVSDGNEVSFTTKPDAPTGLNAVALNSTEIYLNWTKGTGAVKTMVRRGTDIPPSTPADGIQVYYEIGNFVTDTGLTPNSDYNYSAWSWVGGSDIWSDTYATAEATTQPPPDVPDVAGDYCIKGSIKPFDWKSNKEIVVQGGTLYITDQDGHKVEGYFEPGTPIEGWPVLVSVKGYVGPFVRDAKLKIKNTPRLSLVLEVGEYCKYPDKKYVTYILNAKVKWDQKIDKVKSIKGTINGWGEYGTEFTDVVGPSQGQFEGKFTATPLPGGTGVPEGGMEYIEYAQSAVEMPEPGLPAIGLPVIPGVEGTYPIKGSIKFFDWKCNKSSIVVKSGTLHITYQDEEDMHKIEGYFEPGTPIEGWPELVPVKGYVGPFVRDAKLKIKNTPRLSLLLELGEYCKYPDKKYVTYILNATIKMDKKTELVKSMKGTINGWGEWGPAFDDESPSLGQFEGKFTATPISE